MSFFNPSQFTLHGDFFLDHKQQVPDKPKSFVYDAGFTCLELSPSCSQSVASILLDLDFLKTKECLHFLEERKVSVPSVWTVVVKHCKRMIWTCTDWWGLQGPMVMTRACGDKSRGLTYEESRGGELATMALMQRHSNSGGQCVSGLECSSMAHLSYMTEP